MILRNFNQSMKKGRIGESIVRDLLERKGFVVYQPVTDGAHAFDMLAIKNKERSIAIDVKSKARLNKMRATGINQKHFEVYERFSNNHHMPFWLFFVDELERLIYGNCIQALEQESTHDGIVFPRLIRTKGGELIRLWHLDKMINIAALDDEAVKRLVDNSQRSYAYS